MGRLSSLAGAVLGIAIAIAIFVDDGILIAAVVVATSLLGGCIGLLGGKEVDHTAKVLKASQHCGGSYDIHELEEMCKLWHAQHPSGEVTKEEFAKMIAKVSNSAGCDNTAFVTHLFARLDLDRSGTLSFEEAAAAMGSLCRGTPEDRLDFTFAMFDQNSDGALSYAEVKQAIETLELSLGCGLDSPFDEATLRKDFAAAGLDQNYALSLPEFKACVMALPGVKQSMERDSALAAFNHKPSRGIAAMKKAFLAVEERDDAKAVAACLQRNASQGGLNRAQLGAYLSEENDEAKTILRYLLLQLNFEGNTIDAAVRKLVSAISLPGEAQKIDRLVSSFSEAFVRQNCDSFGSPDGAYVLAFSIVMLNTDLHSKAIEKHMTKEQFVSNNRGIDAGQDVDRALLEGVFDRIKAEPLRMSGEGFDESDMSMLGGLIKGIKKASYQHSDSH